MTAFFRFSSRAEPDSALPLPVYRALIGTLFKGAATNAVNVAAYVLLGGYMVWVSESRPMTVAAVMVMITGAARILVERALKRKFEAFTGSQLTRVTDVQRGERIYFQTMALFAMSLGSLLALVLGGADNSEQQFLVLAGSLVFAVSSPGRSSGSPRTVAIQAAMIVVPSAMVMVARNSASGYFTALMGVMLLRHLRDMSISLHGTLVSMLMARRAAEDVADRFDTALNNMARGLVMTDESRRVQVSNQVFADMFGLAAAPVDLPVDSLIAKFIAPLLVGDQAPEAIAEFFDGRGGAEGQWRLADGRILAFSRGAMTEGAVITVADVTAEQEAEQNIQRMARFDPVTGLPNRAYFTDMLNGAIESAKGDGFGLLSVDLDRFKEVNDAYGHHVGDLLLSQAAQRMRDMVGDRGFAARFGGDEFVVLLEAAHRETIAKFAASLIRAVSKPYEIEGKLVRIGASIGAALFPCDAADRNPTTLLKAADMALYDAKASGRGAMKFFVEDMAFAVRRRRSLGAALRDALANGELVLAYQPIVDLSGGGVTAVEALLRWTHPDLGSVSPAEFIPIAEETGAIVEIGAFVLQSACRDALAWPDHVRIAVNLSAVQFERGDLETTVRAALDASGLPAGRLELEITESILIGNHAEVLEKLNRLHGLGVHIALDDFGTGYSSLSYLNDFTFDKVKVDQSFVRDMTGASHSKAVSIIRAVNAIGSDLNMSVVAEGVENAEQIAALRALGVNGAQGYFFSRPAPAEEIGLILLKEMVDLEMVDLEMADSVASPPRESRGAA